MRIGKLVFFSLVIASLVIFGYLYRSEIYRLVYPSLCDRTTQFKIGSIDKEFGISEEAFRKRADEAAKIWNDEFGKKLFEFNPRAELTVNLKFDERQQLTDQIDQLSEKIATSEGQLKPEIVKHQQEVAAFDARTAAFNEQVKYWNERGGAPEEEYNKLVSEQSELQKVADKLNVRARELNQSAAQVNSQVAYYNNTILEFNTVLKQRPEEGLFDGKKNTITIFFYVNDLELVHTLGHEFGHALGMSHVQNPNAVMFSKTNQKTELTREDKKELMRVCARQPFWEILRNGYF